MGAGGGVVGFFAGGALGAAAGVPLSLFTFGLSIPVGAAIGGGAGMCAGALTGGTAGLVGGAAAGHKKNTIADGFTAAANKASDIKELAAGTASTYKNKIAGSTAASAAYMRAKFAGGTGGTSDEK